MSFALADYECPVHGRFEVLVERPVPDAVACHAADLTCGARATWCFPAPMGRVPIAQAVSRGKSDPHRHGQLDTRALGDGMPYNEWRAKEDKKDHDRRWKQNKSRIA